MKRITIDKLMVYYKYSGDIDGFARVGRADEKKSFGSGDWELIDVFIQDLELINKGLTSEKFTKSTLERIKELADEQAFTLLILPSSSPIV